MSAWGKIKNALSLMCIVFTVIISVMYAIGLIISDGGALFVPTPSKALLMLLFSAVLGFASLLLSKDGDSAGKVVIHALLCLGAFILVFVVGGNFPVAGDTSVIATVLYLIVYGVVMVGRALALRGQRRKKNDKAEYNSIFN